MRQAWQRLEKIRRGVDELQEDYCEQAQRFATRLAGIRESLADLTSFLWSEREQRRNTMATGLAEARKQCAEAAEEENGRDQASASFEEAMTAIRGTVKKKTPDRKNGRTDGGKKRPTTPLTTPQKQEMFCFEMKPFAPL